MPPAPSSILMRVKTEIYSVGNHSISAHSTDVAKNEDAVKRPASGNAGTVHGPRQCVKKRVYNSRMRRENSQSPKSRQEKVGATITAIPAMAGDNNRHLCETLLALDPPLQNRVYTPRVRAIRAKQIGVPQTFLSAVSPTFLSAGAATLAAHAGWKTCDTADKNVCGTLSLAPGCTKEIIAPACFGLITGLVLAALSSFGAVQSRPVQPIGLGKAGFSQLPASETAIQFSNILSDAAVANSQILLLGSGVALGDVDSDGQTDIYLCRLEGPNALYRNLGNWKFEDITTAAGVPCPNQYSSGAALADLDRDDDLDLLVNSIGGGTRCFLNDGKGRFTESKNAGFTNRFAATSMALADIEGDGDLDVYVANYRTTTIRSTGLQVLNVNGRRILKPEDREFYEFTKEGLIVEHGESDFLYINDGKGKFTIADFPSHKDWGLSVMFHDMNGDRAPDLYVCNDFQSADRVWINDGKGQFRPINPLAMRNSSTFSMGVNFSDINRDGHDDFLVLDMLSRDHARRMRQRAMAGQNTDEVTRIDARPQVERNTLFLNRGDGTYAEIAQFAGLHASEWSWGLVFMDVDLDGFEDALITTGHGFDTQDADTEQEIARKRSERVGDNVLRYPKLHVPNLAFRNRGDFTFEEMSTAWGFDAVGVSHGIATGDLDNDGDLDVVVNNLNAPVGIYCNNSPAPRIAVRLKNGIGARIKLGNQAQEVISGGRYLSGDDGLRAFAPPKFHAHASNSGIEVIWRNGRRSMVTNVQPNRVYELDAADSVPFNPPQTEIKPFFVEMAANDVTIPEPNTIPPKGLPKGRWNAFAEADFDGDGKLDVVATSWGRNTPFQYFLRDEIRLFDGEIEAYVDPNTRKTVPWRDRETLGAKMPWILEKFPTAKAYGEASLEDIFGDKLRSMKEERFNSLDHMIFLNRGDRFDAKPLPIEAQFAPSLAVAAGDFDQDGAQDIFLAQNFFRVDPQTSRYDAGRGLWLRGDGRGNFTALSGDESGVKIYGEQTGVLLKDVNGDGKLDLAVRQQNADTKFYRNVSHLRR